MSLILTTDEYTIMLSKAVKIIVLNNQSMKVDLTVENKTIILTELD